MFTITESSTRWYCALNEVRSSHFGLDAVPAMPENDRSLSRTPKTPGVNRNTISHSPYEVDDRAFETLVKVSKQGFRVNSRMLRFALKLVENDTQARQLGTLSVHMDEVVYAESFFDWRGRVYTVSGETGSLQVSKACRACMDAPEAVTVTPGSDAHSYMLEVFEHEGWATDLDSAVEFIEEALESRWDDVDFMGVRAALALIELNESGQTAYLLEQDATCSGFQHMALLGGCRRLAEVVNATVSSYRGDLYAEVARLGGVAESLGLTAKQARKLAKKIVMLTGYGSGAALIALGYFNDRFDGKPFETVEDCEHSGERVQFYGLGLVTITELLDWVKPIQKELMKRFPVIRRLQQAAIAYFDECDEAGDEFRWQLADGFEAIRVRPAGERDTDADSSAAGALPNIIHSLDGMTVRYTIEAWDGVLGVVHDAFFTTVDKALQLRQVVREAYAKTHASYGASFPIQRDTACMPIGMCIGV